MLQLLLLLALFGSPFLAHANLELRSPSDIEIEAGLLSQLEATNDSIKANSKLTEEERKLLLEQTAAISEKLDEIMNDIRAKRRELEKQGGKYQFVALSIGFGGETTPLKINLPKVGVGIGGEISGGLIAAFTRNSKNNEEGITFATIGTRGFHASTMLKEGSFLTLNRTQVFPTIKLFFATPAVFNPVSKRHEFVNFNDLNRRFYGFGIKSGWSLKIPLTNISVIKGANSWQMYGAWLGDTEQETDVSMDSEKMERLNGYFNDMLESASPDLLMLSVNIGVGDGQGKKSTIQFETQKVTTAIDNNGSGDSFMNVLKSLVGF